MDFSRRELGGFLGLLGVAEAAETLPALPSHVYHPDQSINLGGREKKGGRILNGLDHSGFQLEMHQTVLAKGVDSHPPHKHSHEELIVVLNGTVESWVEGKTELAPVGSVIYFGSNQLHKLRNGGDDTCRYYVLELRGKSA